MTQLYKKSVKKGERRRGNGERSATCGCGSIVAGGRKTSPRKSKIENFLYIALNTYENMRLLLISNSTMPGEAYLSYPMPEIKKFLGNQSLKALFIPYAAVTFSYDEYEERVKERFAEANYQLTSIHRAKNMATAANTPATIK